MITQIMIMAGPAASGKTTAAKWLEREYGVKLVDVGDVLRRRLNEEGFTCKTRGAIGQVFLKKFDLDDTFSTLFNLVSDRNATIFDAVRFAQTCQQFRERIPKVSVLYVEADSDIRKRRRANSLVKEGWTRGEIEAEWERYSSYDNECPKIRQMSDIVLANNGSFIELYSQIRSALEKLQK